MEKCANCERAIGNMEPAHVVQGHVVCDACNTRLRAGAAGAVSAAARPAPVAAAPRPTAVGYATPPPNDAVATLIPYRNVQALIAYYLGLFSLFPLLGGLMGIAAVILGIRGLLVARRNPSAKGVVHAWVGIICGGVFGLVWIGLVILWVAVVLLAPRPRY